MAEPTHDPWRARLSELLDDELSAAERAAFEAHLAACAGCTRLATELRALVRAARDLPTPVPEHDLWPALRTSLESSMPTRSFPRWPLAFAAGVLVTLALFLAFDRRSRSAALDVAALPGESYLLLLHEPEGFARGTSAAEHAAIVERYSRWAGDLGARCVGGEELESGGFELHPGASPAAAPLAAGEHVGGYFLVQVSDHAEALALAESCPHLEQGGWIELRRIQTHPAD